MFYHGTCFSKMLRSQSNLTEFQGPQQQRHKSKLTDPGILARSESWRHWSIVLSSLDHRRKQLLATSAQKIRLKHTEIEFPYSLIPHRIHNSHTHDYR